MTGLNNNNRSVRPPLRGEAEAPGGHDPGGRQAHPRDGRHSHGAGQRGDDDHHRPGRHAGARGEPLAGGHDASDPSISCRVLELALL